MAKRHTKSIKCADCFGTGVRHMPGSRTIICVTCNGLGTIIITSYKEIKK